VSEKAVIWLEEQPVVTVDGAGVKITYQSGGETYVRRASHSFMRKHARNVLDKLDEWQAKEAARKTVVPLKRGRAKH
jgi:hypothetical protein